MLVCDFSGFRQPEMIKRRPVVVISPRFRQRDGLCTVVPLSTTKPRTVCEYHCQLSFDPVLPAPYSEALMWVKADMICAVSFDRLSLPYMGKDQDGKRLYDIRHISDVDLRQVQVCVLNGMGLSRLTSGV